MRKLLHNKELSGRQRLLTAMSLTLMILQGCDSGSSNVDENLVADDLPISRPDSGENGTPQVQPENIFSEEFSESFGSSAYADDFNSDVLYLSSYSFEDSTGSASASLTDDFIVLRAQSDGTNFSNRYLRLPDIPDAVLVSAKIDAQTMLPANSEAFASVGLSSRLFNTLADNGLGGDDPQLGNVFLDYRVGINATGNSLASLCLSIYQEDGFLPYVISEDGTSCWTAPGSTALMKDELFTFGYGLDADGRTLSLVFNDDKVSFDLPDDVYKAFDATVIVQAIQENGTGQAVVSIPSLQLNSTIFDVSKQQIKLDQIELESQAHSQPTAVSVVDGQIQFTVESLEEDYKEQSMRQLVPSDYLETILTLSSRSVIGTGNVRARLEAVLYNDLAAEGRDGRLGDVRASIQLTARSNGSREAEVCLVRSNDAQFNDGRGLLDVGERDCRSLPMRVKLDTPYRVAIALDRAAQNVIFRINGMVVTEAITTFIGDAEEPSARVVAIAENGAIAVVFADDVRTAPTSLTATEIEADLQTVPEFPSPQDAPAANSDIAPVFDSTQSLAFIDDFSELSNQFGFNEDEERGVAGLSAVDDGIELRASTFSDFAEDGSYSELYINGDTQAVKAKVSLSSRSDLPEDPEARALIRLQGTLFRDNQDFPLNDQTGDIYSSMEVQLRGDGGRQISYYVSRRIKGADDERLNILNGENGGRFDEIIPELDTVYELGIRLDSELNRLIFSVNENVREFDLPWQAFPAARNDAIVQLQHRGSSGRAIGTLHGVETDAVSEDLSVAIPLIGPYRPAFDARFRSQSVQVADGQLNLTTDARIPDSRPARLIGLGTSNYVGASLTLSSASIVEADETGTGAVAGRIGGLVYRTKAVEDLSDSTGKVYAALSLVQDAEGETYAEYCAYESQDSDFSSSEELIGGNVDNCPRFVTQVSLDTEYPVYIQYDELARTIAYEFAGERVVYDIRGEALPVEDGFQGPQARASGKSLAVVLVDDLSFSATPVPLSSSPQRLVISDPQ